MPTKVKFVEYGEQSKVKIVSYGEDMQVIPVEYGEQIKVKIVEYGEDFKVKIVQDTSSCFITTACVEAAGLPDDCIELQTLRQFRDSYLQKSKEGRRMIREYYKVAPRIVKEIRKKTNSSEILSEIFEDIKKIVSQIKNGNSRKAIISYKDIILRLEKEYTHDISD